MAAIIEENLKQYRKSMDVFYTLYSGSVSPTVTNLQNAYTDINSKISDLMNITKVADLEADGFELDGSRIPLPFDEEDNIKTGYLGKYVADVDGNIAIPMSFSVTATSYLYFMFPQEMIGVKFLVGSNEYTAKYQINIPASGTVTVSFPHAKPYFRAKVDFLSNGYMINCTPGNIKNSSVVLRSDTSIKPVLQVSEFEVNIRDDGFDESVFPYLDGYIVKYWAGYQGDYSKARTFIAKEVASDDGIVTIRGEDRIYKLENPLEEEDSIGVYGSNTEVSEMYEAVKTWLSSSYSSGPYPDLVYEATPADGVNTKMLHKFPGNVSKKAFCEDEIFFSGAYFVDAGLPSLHNGTSARMQYPVTFCSKVKKEYEKKLDTVLWSYTSIVALSNLYASTLAEMEIEANQGIEAQRMDTGLYLNDTLSAFLLKGETTDHNDRSVQVGEGYGYAMVIVSPGAYKVTLQLVGRAAEERTGTTSASIGNGSQETVESVIAPEYSQAVSDIIKRRLTEHKPLKMSFTWHGNPHVQQRDYLILPTGEKIDVEEITMEFENGGMLSNVVGRLV